MTFKIKPLLFIALPVLATVSLSYFIQGLILTHQQEFTRWLSSFGPYLILVYIVLQFISVIFAPLGGFFLVVVMIALFGPGIALTLAYFVVTPAYLVNFLISRRYGRPLAERIIGKATMEKVDHYVQDAGVFTLIILRLFQGGSFDYLSYGLGLTKVPFKTFAIVTILAGVPGTLLSYFVISRLENLTVGVISIYAIATIFFLLAVYLNHRFKKHKLDKS